MRTLATVLVMIAGSAVPAFAGGKGDFIGPGTYATVEGCTKLKAIAAGTARSVSTVPEVLTADGFLGWEGDCTFRSVTEIVKGKTWKASMDCHEGAQEGPESDIFERTPDGSIKVTVMGKDTTFIRCDGEKGK